MSLVEQFNHTGSDYEIKSGPFKLTEKASESKKKQSKYELVIGIYILILNVYKSVIVCH